MNEQMLSLLTELQLQEEVCQRRTRPKFASSLITRVQFRFTLDFLGRAIVLGKFLQQQLYQRILEETHIEEFHLWA